MFSRGLAGRLAATEDNLDQLSFESDKFDNRWIKLRRKKEKLELQLSEALFIRSTIERRKSKVISRFKIRHRAIWITINLSVLSD